MSKNTIGRIKFAPNGEANSYAMLDEHGNWLLSILHNGTQVTERQVDNMRRLAACWNRLLPFTTEQIEDGIDLVGLVMQRQALLEALQEMLDLVELAIPFDGPQQRKARRAIADAERTT